MRPLDVVCSYCNAPIDARCTRVIDGPPITGNRVQVPYYHAERVDAAMQQLTETVVAETRSSYHTLDEHSKRLFDRIERLETLVAHLGNFAEATDKSFKLHNERLDFVTRLAKKLSE